MYLCFQQPLWVRPHISYLINRIPCAMVISTPLIGSPCMTEAQLYVITLRILRGSNFYEHCWFCVTASEVESTVYWIFYECLLTWHFERLWEVRMATATFQFPVKTPLLVCFPSLGTCLCWMLKSQKPHEIRWDITYPLKNMLTKRNFAENVWRILDYFCCSVFYLFFPRNAFVLSQKYFT